MTSSLLELGAPTLGAKGTTPCPVNLTRLPGLDISARYHSDRCGGDFFDGQTIGSRLVFLLTDIAGPRSEAHAIAVEAQHAFRHTAWDLFSDPAANESDAIATLAHDVNRALMDAANGVRFAPTFLGCFNAELGILTYCNAGRVLAVFRDVRTVQVLERGGVPLGLFTHVTYEPAVLAFERDDKLLLVTKGVTESRRGAAEFGSKRIKRLLVQANGNSASSICDTVLREAYEFGNHPWSRLYDFLHPRRQRNNEDLTAVAIVRR
ncbi:MAG TPA: PP2C family protein-serine/threonine phosphatase [Acidobacteriaceae bacterium]|nr:PP2C family protein-serine/threonine phosphatase [Acidobacteriaceae bacterium]